MATFDIKQKTNEVLNTFRMEIQRVHGDGDHYETVFLGPYVKDELFILSGIVKAFEEMEKSDKETNNDMAYDRCVNFRRFLKKHWKYDLFALRCGIYRYAYMKDYHIYYTDENGVEYEIENLVYSHEPTPHYYLKVQNGNRFDTFFYEWDVIATFETLDDKTLKQWHLIELTDGKEFLDTFSFEEVGINRTDFEEDREFLITAHFEPRFETVEQEETFFDFLDELKK